MKEIWKAYRLQIIYVILLTSLSPLACLWIIFVDKVFKAMGDSATGWTVLLVFIPVGIYWCIVLAIGIINIIISFKTYKNRGVTECINGMLIHKYGLVIFFIINFLLLFAVYFLATFGVLIGSRGLAIIFAPVLLPWLVFAVCWSVFCTWLAVLPGSFYSIQVIRASYRAHKIGFGGALCHTILQFLFLTDVLDSMYLATKHWGRGKKSSIIIGAIYLAGVAAIIWLIMRLR